MRSLLASLLALAALTGAQSIVGTVFVPNDGSDGNGGNNPSSVVPDVSVIGDSTITDSGDGDGGFMTIQTVPNPTTAEPGYVRLFVAPTARP